MPRKHQGWSLVESMVVLTIVAVMVAWGLPSFVGVVQQARLSAATHTFLSAMALARSEGIKRNARIVMCVAVSDTACATTGHWNQGWLLYEDVNGNGVFDESERLIHYQTGLHHQLLIKGNSTVSRYVSYGGTGRSYLHSGAFQAGTITICHRANSTAQGRSVVINAVGRPRVQMRSASLACE
jgi:type IV fimbrial biogenesis protein FimT